MTDTVALYLRLSPRPDGQYEGVDRQETWGRAYAARMWPGAPVRAFSDTGLSAANGGPRPGYEALRDAVVAGEIAHVWCVEQSRLERTEVGWFELAAELAEHGITELHTDRDGVVRLDDAVGGIKAVLNAHESRRLRRRVNDALNDLAAQGRPGGAKHIAYRHGRDGDGRATLEVEPTAAEAVRWAADRVLSGWTLTAVAAEFTRRGVATVNGGRWTHDNVKGALTAPVVAGLRVHRGEVVGSGTWEPVLDEVTWRRLCARLDGKRRRRTRTYLLSGIARCGRCDAGLTGRMQTGRGGRRPIYFCASATGGCDRLGINAGPLDDLVTDELLTELDKPEFRAALAADDHDEARARIEAELADLDTVRQDYARQAGRREIRPEEWRVIRSGLDDDEARLSAELAALPAPVASVDFAEIRAALVQPGAAAERRELVAMFVEAVVIIPAKPGTRQFDPGRISIVWR